MNRSALLKGRSGPARIMDVAQRAGVSLKSVSRVINDEPHVTPKLRAKVEAAIRELNYIPDTAARSLAGARSFTVGILFDNPSPNYTMEAMGGAYRACRNLGYHLRIDHVNSDVPDASLAEQLDAILRNSRNDGFVLTPPLSDDPRVLDHFDQRGVKFVRVAPVDRGDRSPCVFIDDAEAAAELARHLWDRGHRRFGMIRGPAHHGASAHRRSGFVGQLRALDPAIEIAEVDGDFEFASGIEGGRKLLASSGRPTAIFAANDDMAAGAMVACAQANLSIPGDVSICGFDDSWVAKSVWPYLTTIYQPIADMADVAVNLLLRRDSDKTAPAARKLDYRLIERASVGSPSQG